MLQFENTIRIDRPIQEVFTFLSHYENIPKWNYFVLEVTEVSEGSAGVGKTYHQVRKTDEQDFRIVGFEPNHKIVVQTLPESSPQFERRFTLLVEGKSTKLIDKWKLDTGKPFLIEKLAARRVKSAVAENLDKLKQLLEGGEVTLQDGRQITL